MRFGIKTDKHGEFWVYQLDSSGLPFNEVSGPFITREAALHRAQELDAVMLLEHALAAINNHGVDVSRDLARNDAKALCDALRRQYNDFK